MLRQKAHDRAVPLANLVLDPKCQLRADIRQTVVQDYSDVLEDELEAAKAGNRKPKWPFPELVVFYQEGSAHVVADGWHRALATRKVKWPKPIPCEVNHGTLRDAILYAAGANQRHGIRRTNEDKRRSVLVLLHDREWRKWATAEIARRCGVSTGLVEIIRQREGGAADPERRLHFKGDGKIGYTSRKTDRGRKRNLAEEVGVILGNKAPENCPYCGRPMLKD